MSKDLNLNLGSGTKKITDYINVDKYETLKPDIVHDLEKFPYPFKDNSVTNIILSHVLEHIGQDPNVFNSIMKEIYRICKNQALISITVPHPRHNDFLSDPTHVRPINVPSLELYNKELNKQWQKQNAANTPLALIHNVDFRIKFIRYDFEQKYYQMLKDQKISKDELGEMMDKYNNVVKQIYIQLEVIK